MSEQPKIPKFRVSAAFVSPAALCLIAGTIWFFSLERASEEEVEATVKKEFPQVGVFLYFSSLVPVLDAHSLCLWWREGEEGKFEDCPRKGKGGG